MTYATTNNRINPAAILGALGVPGGMAALLVTGLAITVVIDPEPDNPIAVQVEVPIIEPIVEPLPPTDDKVVPTQTPDTKTPEIVPTRPDSEIKVGLGPTAPITGLPPLGPGVDGPITPITLPPVTPPGPAFSPVGATPRGNVGGWITDSDYRTSWINRDYSGVAGFSLSVDARGRVTNCSITQSTGHAALDEATCRLLARRARFEPATDSSGNTVAGTFSSSVNWKIPE